MWWNTTIDDITITDDKNIRAAATITFSSGHDALGNFYKEEKGSVQFLTGNTLRASSNMQSFLSGSETTWKPAGGPQNNQQQHSIVKKIESQSSNYSEESDDSVRYITTTAAAGKRRRLENRTADTQQRRPPINQHVDELRVSYGAMQRQLNAVQTRLSAVEYKTTEKEVTRRVLQTKMFIRYELQRNVKRPHSKLTGENDTTFHTVLRRCPIQFSISCTLSDFTDLVNDMQGRFIKGLQFLPSLAVLSTGTNPLAAKHVVFDHFYTMLSWLGISDMAAAKNFVVHKTFRKDIKILQLLAGMQWDYENQERPLNIFIGIGCDRCTTTDVVKEEDDEIVVQDACDDNLNSNNQAAALAEIQNTSDERPSISLESAKWNDVSGCFSSQFKRSSSKTGSTTLSYQSLMDHDAFTITWRPLPGLRPQHFTMMGEQVVLGKLYIYLPAVLIAGAATCNEVNEILNDEEETFFPSSA